MKGFWSVAGLQIGRWDLSLRWSKPEKLAPAIWAPLASEAAVTPSWLRVVEKVHASDATPDHTWDSMCLNLRRIFCRAGPCGKEPVDPVLLSPSWNSAASASISCHFIGPRFLTCHHGSSCFIWGLSFSRRQWADGTQCQPAKEVGSSIRYIKSAWTIVSSTGTEAAGLCKTYCKLFSSVWLYDHILTLLQ